MTWFTTKVSKLEALADELQRLEDASHTIRFIEVIDGYTVIISTTSA